MPENCFDCRYWVADGLEAHDPPDEERHWNYGSHEGRCVRHPPRIVPLRIDGMGDEFEPLSRWPTTMSCDWCGEFEARQRTAMASASTFDLSRLRVDPRRS